MAAGQSVRSSNSSAKSASGSRLPCYLLAFSLERGEKFLHVLGTGAEVYGIDSEIRTSLQFGSGNPEAAAFLDALGHLGVQILCVRLAETVAAIANTNGRHKGFGGS